MAGIESTTGTTWSTSYEYYSDTPVNIVIMALNYDWMQIPYTLTSTNATIPVQQIYDRNYSS